MKVVLLAGGYGTRIIEESHLRPKPLIEIGSKPILWHIMKIYSYYGFNDFIICCGYKSNMIKKYFLNYYLLESNITVKLQDNSVKIHNSSSEPWKVTLVDTGIDTMTGSRIKKIKKYVGSEPFMFSYGDGVSNIDLRALLEFHNSHGKIATVTTVEPNSKFGVLNISDNGLIHNFTEKPKQSGFWINGGFSIFENEIFQYIEDGDSCILEDKPFKKLSEERQMMAYKHNGFWYAMDTTADKRYLQTLWDEGNAPWKIWSE